MSRLKSAPAGKGPKLAKTGKAGKAGKPARSAPAGGRGVYVQSAKSDIFVVLLAVSLGAILLGCLFLGLVMNRYDFKTSPTAGLAPEASSPALLASNSEKFSISDSVRL